MVIVPNFCFKEFRFGLHSDFIVLMVFLHVLGSIEGRFISAPNTFKQTLGLFCRNYRFVNPIWDVLCLGIFGAWWCIFVDKGGQGSVILLIESVDFLGRLLSSSEARRSVFNFSLSVLWYLRKMTVVLLWDMGVERFRVKLIEKGKGISGMDIGNIVIVGFG